MSWHEEVAPAMLGPDDEAGLIGPTKIMAGPSVARFGGSANPFPDRPGAVYVATCLRGLAEICVYPLLFGGGRILLGPTGELYDGGADAGWDYERLEDAIQAAHAWNGSGHPAGAYRYLDPKGPPIIRRPLQVRSPE